MSPFHEFVNDMDIFSNARTPAAQEAFLDAMVSIHPTASAFLHLKYIERASKAELQRSITAHRGERSIDGFCADIRKWYQTQKIPRLLMRSYTVSEIEEIMRRVKLQSPDFHAKNTYLAGMGLHGRFTATLNRNGVFSIADLYDSVVSGDFFQYSGIGVKYMELARKLLCDEYGEEAAGLFYKSV